MPKMMQNRMCAPGKSRRGIGGVLRKLFTYSNKIRRKGYLERLYS